VWLTAVCPSVRSNRKAERAGSCLHAAKPTALPPAARSLPCGHRRLQVPVSMAVRLGRMRELAVLTAVCTLCFVLRGLFLVIVAAVSVAVPTEFDTVRAARVRGSSDGGLASSATWAWATNPRAFFYAASARRCRRGRWASLPPSSFLRSCYRWGYCCGTSAR
jgi:hypothetical protein